MISFTFTMITVIIFRFNNQLSKWKVNWKLPKSSKFPKGPFESDDRYIRLFWLEGIPNTGYQGSDVLIAKLCVFVVSLYSQIPVWESPKILLSRGFVKGQKIHAKAYVARGVQFLLWFENNDYRVVLENIRKALDAGSYISPIIFEHYLRSYLLLIDGYCAEYHSVNLIIFSSTIAIHQHRRIPLLVSFHPESVFYTTCAVQNGVSGQFSSIAQLFQIFMKTACPWSASSAMCAWFCSQILIYWWAWTNHVLMIHKTFWELFEEYL